MASKLSLQIMVRNIFSDLPSYFLIIISKPGFIYLFPILLGFVRIYFCELILYDKYLFNYSPVHHRLQDVSVISQHGEVESYLKCRQPWISISRMFSLQTFHFIHAKPENYLR